MKLKVSEEISLGPWVVRDRIRVREAESKSEVVGVVWGLDPDRAAGLLIREDVARFKVGIVDS